MADRNHQFRTASDDIETARRAFENLELPASASPSAHAVRGMTIARLAECRDNVDAILVEIEGAGSC